MIKLYIWDHSKRANKQISCNIGKSAKNPAWIYKFFYATANLHFLFHNYSNTCCLNCTNFPYHFHLLSDHRYYWTFSHLFIRLNRLMMFFVNCCTDNLMMKPQLCVINWMQARTPDCERTIQLYLLNPLIQILVFYIQRQEWRTIITKKSSTKFRAGTVDRIRRTE